MNAKSLLSAIFLLVCYNIYAQGTVALIRPFTAPLNDIGNIMMASDTAGMVWFAAGDTVGDSVFITNEKHTVNYSLANDPFNNNQVYNLRLMADSRNDLWASFGSGKTIVYRVHNAVAQKINLYLPDLSFQPYNVFMADNHHGTDYFFYEVQKDYIDTSSNFVVLDSLFFMSFDGITYQKTNMASVLVPGDTETAPANVICDYSGNVYVTTAAGYTYKYNGTTWSVSPLDFGNIGTNNICAYNNVFYGNNDGQNITTISATGQVTYIYNCGAGNLNLACVLQTRDSSIWMVNEWGLLKYENGGFVLKAGQFFMQLNSCEPWGPAVFDAIGNLFITSTCGRNVLVFNLYSEYLIDGTVFIDTNQNGIQDSVEKGLGGFNVIQAPDNMVANTDTSGKYQEMYLYPSENCTVSFNCPPYYHTTTHATYTLAANTDTMCCYNFGIAPNGVIQDLQVNAAPDFAVRGYVNYQWLAFQNSGTTIVSDTVVYQFDPRYSYINSYPVADVVQGNLVKWAYSNLAPFEIRNAYVELQLDSSIPDGTQLYDTAIIYPLSTDTTQANNVYALQQTVYSSFDPNHKTVTPAGAIDPAEVLTYTVYFQNTGNSPAVNIVIDDTLDRSLNFSTFKLLGSSNPVKYQLKGNGIVQFTFSNIQLPDSTSNPSGSIGYVRYSIQADSNLYIGQDIRNTAWINFDFNAPVVTNTTNSYYGVSAIPQITPSGDAYIYPNPTNNNWFLSVSSSMVGSPYQVIDLDGRMIYQSEIRQPVTELSVLAAGVYLLRIQSSTGVIVKKIVKL